MWTDTTRALHSRKEQRLPRYLTDSEWKILEPYFTRASHIGRPRKWPMRMIVDALLYMLRGGLPTMEFGEDDASRFSSSNYSTALFLPLA